MARSMCDDNDDYLSVLFSHGGSLLHLSGLPTITYCRLRIAALGALGPTFSEGQVDRNLH